MKHYLGVDVGGTTTTISIGNESHQVLTVGDQFSTHSAEGPKSAIQAIVENAIATVESVGGNIREVPSVGLATPGPATFDGVLQKTPNLDPALWDGFPIRAELETALRLQAPDIVVHYLGDGQAAALGEYAIRSGGVTWDKLRLADEDDDRLTSLLMAVVGTGLGGGVVRDGRVMRGKAGRAGHIGHITLPPYAFRHEHDRQLTVGHATCTAESAVSLTSLTHQLGYRLTLDAWKDHPLNAQEGSVRDKAKQLRELADDGDELALELFIDQAHALGIALLNADYLGDYDLLVIGGGICGLSESLREQYQLKVEESYRRYALDAFKNVGRIEFSVCGDDAPVIGALAHLYFQSMR